MHQYRALRPVGVQASPIIPIFDIWAGFTASIGVDTESFPRCAYGLDPLAYIN